jgi:hypothetical protein
MDTETPTVEVTTGQAAAAAPPQDILAAETAEQADYKETDVFTWANNLVQYKDELKVDVFLINKNYVVYKTNMGKELGKQLEPIFVDELLEFVLEGAAEGLQIRGFEEAESEKGVLQRTQVFKVEKLQAVLNWLKHQAHEIEMFKEQEHDIKRIKGVMARISHPDLKEPAYVFKVLPQSQVMKGSVSWMIRGERFVPFDADAALRVPSDPQLLVLDQDIYVFNQAKLKALFGYDAKEAAIAEKKVAEIEENFKLSFEEGVTLNSLVMGKKAAIKKLQKIDPGAIKQEDLLNHAEELDIELMTDPNGAIIIMDDKDMSKFVNLLNDDYIESPLTGQRYEIIKKRELKPDEGETMFGEPVV